MKMIKIKGVEIPLIYESSKQLPMGFVGVIFNGGGSIAEKKIGVASFSADLLNRGTKEKGEIKFADELESSAINLSVDSGVESLKFGIEFLKDKEDRAFKLLGELLKSPNLTSEALKQSKINLVSYILSKENDFDYIASKNLKKVIFKGTPLSNSANITQKSIESISLNDVKAHIKQTFVLDNVVIIAGGDLELESLKKKLTKLLDFLPTLPKNAKKYESKKYTINPKPQTIATKTNTKQAYIYFAAPFNFEGYAESLHKAQVMSFILGSSGFGSRIMEEVRVKRGLAYSAYAYNALSNNVSYFNGYLQTKLDNKDEAIKVVREVIREFSKNGASKDELDSAKAYILGSKPLGEETLAQRVNKKYNNFNRGLPLNYDETYIQKIKNLTLDELNAYIKAHGEINNLTISIVEND